MKREESVATGSGGGSAAAVGDKLRPGMDATDLVNALASGHLSSRDVLEEQIRRVQSRNPALNAVVSMNLEDARQRADLADAATRRGESWGPLHGLSITLKDTWEMPGMPCVAGAPEFRGHMPRVPAVAVQRLLAAGAIVYGKTNVPYMASDIQSFNKVYGTTHNPLDAALTPGGSSGGAAAALAAGFTSLELGSDLAGSIRIPAHYCNVHGHKSTYGVIPLRGHVPGPPGTLGSPPMAVAGPMGRSARDLRLMMDVLTDTRGEPAGPTVSLLPGRGSDVSVYRVLLWTDDAFCPVDPAIVKVYQVLGDQLKAAGVSVTVGKPVGVSLEEVFSRYMLTLGSMMGVPLPAAQRRVMGLAAHMVPLVDRLTGLVGRSLPTHLDKYLAGIDMRYAEARRLEESTLQFAERLSSVFHEYDVVLMPVACTTAIPHNQHPALPLRRIAVNGEQRDYLSLFTWVSLASLLGWPATSLPVGRCDDGRPVNVQVLGPRFGDHVTLGFAAAWEAAARPQG
jgi:amidase